MPAKLIEKPTNYTQFRNRQGEASEEKLKMKSDTKIRTDPLHIKIDSKDVKIKQNHKEKVKNSK